ncbi:putative gustatory receptor 28a [Sitophilus oryzae]|uniref:Gustatory receptor 28a n=1 Tax=Sitophilus oryzae TaxID=7048 RepID=A0A6J2XMJ2_SITOR|nr:putative gustatory receptor 28a [Sitophilus oryzae]
MYLTKLLDNIAYSITTIYIVYTMIVQFCLMICCDKAKRSSEKLLITCLNLQEKYPSSSDEYHELSVFADKLSHRKIQFTAANFFEIQRSTLFGVIGNTTTYFIALVQFGNSDRVEKNQTELTTEYLDY